MSTSKINPVRLKHTHNTLFLSQSALSACLPTITCPKYDSTIIEMKKNENIKSSFKKT